MKFILPIENQPYLVDYINHILTTSKHRVIILFCERNNDYAHGSCFNKYYRPVDEIIATGLFETSFQELKTRPGVFWQVNQLPLIEAMGLFQLSFIKRDRMGKVTVSDGFCHPITYHLGID